MNAEPQAAAPLSIRLKAGQRPYIDQMCRATGQGVDEYLDDLFDGAVAQQIGEFLAHRPEPPGTLGPPLKSWIAKPEHAPRRRGYAPTTAPLAHCGNKPIFSDQDIAKIRAMRGAGEKVTAIAARYGVAPMTIRRYLHRANAD